jgi:hypothetical protein
MPRTYRSPYEFHLEKDRETLEIEGISGSSISKALYREGYGLFLQSDKNNIKINLKSRIKGVFYSKVDDIFDVYLNYPKENTTIECNLKKFACFIKKDEGEISNLLSNENFHINNEKKILDFLVSENKLLEKNKIYFEKQNNCLSYTCLDVNDEIIFSKLATKKLPTSEEIVELLVSTGVKLIS